MASAVHLSCDRDQTRRLHRRAMRQITNTLEVCLNSTRSKEQWSRLRRDKHQELYAKSIDRGGTSTNGPSSVYYLAVNEASCGFEEAINLLQVDSTARFRLLMKLLHGRDFKDGALTAISTNDHQVDLAATESQHAAIWFIYQDHRKSVLLRDQHLTFFQTLKVFVPDTQQLQHHDQDYQNAAASLSAASLLAGRSARLTGGVHKRTIALSWLPLPRSQDVGRETARQVDLQYTLIIEEISVNRLRLSCVTSSSPDEYDGSLTGSPWAARAIAKRLALRSVGKFEAAVAASRIGGCQFVAPHQWVKNEDRASCVICWKRFNALFRRRHHCRLCGEVICGSCSSLRTTNVVDVRTRAAQKTRICHMCHNEARLKTGTHTFSSINPNHQYNSCSSSRIPSSEYRPRAQPPLLGSDSESELPLQSRVLPTTLNDVTAPDFDVLSPSVALMPSERTMTENFEASSTIHEFEEAEMDSYIGPLPDRSTDAVVSNKIISIKSITRRTKNFWQAMPSTTSINKGRWPFQVLDSSSSVNSTCSVHSSDWTGGRNSISGGVEALTFEGNTSRSFLHPLAVTSKSKRTPQPMGITAEASSYSSVERSFRSSYELVNSKEQDEEDSRWFAYRRTSMMSSNAGLLDQESSAYEGYFLPALDISRETERLKLLELIISPACTLVDRTIMHRSCEIAAAAFGLSAAFIARVDEAFVRIEHSIGTCGLSPQEEILRRESLCDFVLCQPQDQPLVVLDCLADPRTRDIPMVQHLCMRFFIGISVCVRGLPIACLCVFEQDDGNRCEGDEELVSASHYELGILKNAARRMEDELESLVHGLEFC